MIDRTLILRNLWSSMGRYRVVLFFIATAAAALLLLSAVVGQGASNVSAQLSHNSAVSSLQIASASTTGNAVQLDRKTLAAVAAVAHVKSVDPWAQEGIIAQSESLWADPGTPLVFWATPRIAYAQPKIVSPLRARVANLAPDQILLPSRVGSKSFSKTVGKTFTFTYTVATGASSGVDQKISLAVVGLYDNSVPGNDGTSAVYISQSLESKLIAARAGLPHALSPGDSYVYPEAYVNVDGVDHVTAVQTALAKRGYNVSSIASQVTQLPGLLRLLSYLNTAIAVILLLFCFGSGISIGSAWLAQRGREIGLLRALGWTRARIFVDLVLEIGAAGVVCGIAGIATGLILSVLASLALSGRTVDGIEFADGVTLPGWYWFAGVLVGLPVALAIGAIRPVSRLARLAPDDALRQL
jgi:hypothetical protein